MGRLYRIFVVFIITTAAKTWIIIRRDFVILLFMVLWIMGIAHSANKHRLNDTVVSVLIPPWGLYRGVESFWHKDVSIENNKP
jgi:hypothetical protein